MQLNIMLIHACIVVGEKLVRLSALLLIIPPLVTSLRIIASGMYGVAPVDMVGTILGVVCQWLLFIFPLIKPIDGKFQLAYIFLIFLSLMSLIIWPLLHSGLHRWDGTMQGSVGLFSFPFLWLGLRRLAQPLLQQQPPRQQQHQMVV